MTAAARPAANLRPHEKLFFLLTNRLPRRWLTLLVGRLSRIEHPFVCWLLISMWKPFVDDLRLDEAKKQRFRSLHDCFTRELTPGARPLDTSPDVIVSPCDAVVGEFGNVKNLEVLQAKGFPYSISDLLLDRRRAERFASGRYVTLRLKSSMYHRFHAPCDARIESIQYVSGDTWNVHPIALRAVENLFCKNERAVIDLLIDQGHITMVPVAAILVASMRFHGLAEPLNLRYRGPSTILLQRSFEKGEEIGFFEHGSTIILFATAQYCFADNVATGEIIRMGQPLLRVDRIDTSAGK